MACPLLPNAHLKRAATTKSCTAKSARTRAHARTRSPRTHARARVRANACTRLQVLHDTNPRQCLGPYSQNTDAMSGLQITKWTAGPYTQSTNASPAHKIRRRGHSLEKRMLHDPNLYRNPPLKGASLPATWEAFQMVVLLLHRGTWSAQPRACAYPPPPRSSVRLSPPGVVMVPATGPIVAAPSVHSRSKKQATASMAPAFFAIRLQPTPDPVSFRTGTCEGGCNDGLGAVTGILRQSDKLGWMIGILRKRDCWG